MSNLALVENGLVNVYEHGTEKERIIKAKELYDFLNVEGKMTRFNDWITRKIEKYGFTEGEDFYSLLSKSNGGRPSTEYYLKMDTAKEIAMVENNNQGKQIRKYFIEVEKKFRQQNSMVPMSIEDLIIMQAQTLKDIRLSQEKIQHEQEQLKLQQTQTENKVTLITTYLAETPDRKKIEREVNAYARRHNLKESDVRVMVYRKIEDKYGIDIMQRVKNKHKQINQEREANGDKPYAQSTLKSKYNGVDFLIDNNMLKEVMEILAGLDNM